jgi:hypothetical protein
MLGKKHRPEIVAKIREKVAIANRTEEHREKLRKAWQKRRIEKPFTE